MTNIQSLPKIELELTLNKGTKETVSGRVYGEFVIHHTLAYGDGEYSDRWSITHLETGQSLFNYLHKAKNALSVVDEIQNTWGKLVLEQVTSPYTNIISWTIRDDKMDGFKEFYLDTKAKINQGILQNKIAT